MVNRDKRKEIIKAGTEIIAINGFNAAGLDSILKKAGVPKGSFYYYFKNKEDFGLAIIEKFATDYDKKLHGFLDDERYEPLKRIENYLDASIKSVRTNNYSKGCLIGNLGQELSDQNEQFRTAIDTIFHNWTKLFSQCLQKAVELGQLAKDTDVEKLGGFILASWEGAILRSKVMKSDKPMLDFVYFLFSIILK